MRQVDFHSVFHSCGNLWGTNRTGDREIRSLLKGTGDCSIPFGQSDHLVDIQRTTQLALKVPPDSTVRDLGADPSLDPTGVHDHERQAYLPAQHAPPEEDPRLPCSHVNQEWSDCPEATPSQGAEAAHGRRRRLGRWARSSPSERVSSSAQNSSACTKTAAESVAAS